MDALVRVALFNEAEVKDLVPFFLTIGLLCSGPILMIDGHFYQTNKSVIGRSMSFLAGSQ